MNRFEIVFRRLDEAVDSATTTDSEADVAEIRAIREESDAVEAVMRATRQISQQTECACFTTT